MYQAYQDYINEIIGKDWHTMWDIPAHETMDCLQAYLANRFEKYVGCHYDQILCSAASPNPQIHARDVISQFMQHAYEMGRMSALEECEEKCEQAYQRGFESGEEWRPVDLGLELAGENNYSRR